MKISGLDRFLMQFAPGWTLARIRARAAVETMARHYEAASVGRRTSGWARDRGDADSTVTRALAELRMHARDLIRNNAWARRGQRVVANNVVGWGIVPKAAGPNPAANSKAMELWRAWADSTDCESEGRHTFYGIQHLAMKTIVEAGEVLIRKRPRRPEDGLAIPLQLEVLEPDWLDHTKTLAKGLAGGPVIGGVEFDLLGRRAAYWIFQDHPGSAVGNPGVSRRILASEILHVYYAERPGQSRGASWLASAILSLKDLDEYEDAELMKQKVAALFVGAITDLDGAGTSFAEQSDEDPLVEVMEPGMIAKLPPGKSIQFGTPPAVADSGFAARNLRRIAAALGVTYEDLTGDYSQVNFSSARMARLAHWSNVHDWRWHMLIPLLCDGVWDWAMEAAQIGGLLPAGYVSAEWTAPPMPMIEPDKEGLAFQRLIRNGLMTLSGALREQGEDPDAHLAEYAADNARLDALGIILDSDPRNTTNQGQEQASTLQASAPSLPAPKRVLDPEIDVDLEDLFQ